MCCMLRSYTLSPYYVHLVTADLHISTQCWVKTASQCTPPSSTPTSIWSATMLLASPTSAWRSTSTARAGRAPVSQRRRVCGTGGMPNGSMCTSTVQEHRLPPCSEQPGPGKMTKTALTDAITLTPKRGKFLDIFCTLTVLCSFSSFAWTLKLFGAFILHGRVGAEILAEKRLRGKL